MSLPPQPPKLDSLAAEPLPLPDNTPESAPIRKDVELGYDRTGIELEVDEERKRKGSEVGSAFGFGGKEKEKEKGKGKEKEHGKGLTEGDAGMLRHVEMIYFS